VSRLHLEIQRAVSGCDLPTDEEFRRWVSGALGASSTRRAEVTIRLVDRAESARLNEVYRNKKGPTNVLSFAYEKLPGIHSDLLGDLAICASLVSREAAQQGKPEQAHWAHLVVHGILHLRGHDHENQSQAQAMETLEREILATLGFADPYGQDD
jgi:probable rRNA maturation factor